MFIGEMFPNMEQIKYFFGSQLLYKFVDNFVHLYRQS